MSGLQPGRGKTPVWERVGGLGDSQTFDTERCNSDRWTRLGLFSSDLMILASKSWELTFVSRSFIAATDRGNFFGSYADDSSSSTSTFYAIGAPASSASLTLLDYP
ncbi:hypothetical protein Zmor_012595 [Zophobas morio]|uniref:Uncharacterized protein n=1 Tax=Zophobas morio TaxID=2755281 RepID=A0AA38I991_9CUCU|nr:hypothetical protein Zmor_012595 [Zophobas morio]